jgi:hypothetical protein
MRGGRTGHRRLFALAGLALLTTASGAHADDSGGAAEEGPRHFGVQRTVGFGPAIGLGGSGAMAGAQLAPVGVWVSGGYAPLLVFGNKRDADRTVTFDGYHSAEINADVSVFFLTPSKRIDAGLIAGYRYNSVLSHGVGLGVAMTYDLSPALAVFLSVEDGIFPSANDQLLAAGYPRDRDAALPWLQGGANVGLMIFP